MNYSVAGFQVFVFFIPLLHQQEPGLNIWTFHVVMMKPAVFCVDKILLMLHGSLSVQMDAPNQNFQKIFAASIIWSMGFKICASLTKVRPTFNEQKIQSPHKTIFEQISQNSTFGKVFFSWMLYNLWKELDWDGFDVFIIRLRQIVFFFPDWSCLFYQIIAPIKANRRRAKSNRRNWAEN